MKNALTLFALMVSVSGIMVSLAREEVRCYLGLSSSSCQSQENSASSSDRSLPTSNHDNLSSKENTQPAEENRQPLVKTAPQSEITKSKPDSLDVTPVKDSSNNNNTSKPLELSPSPAAVSENSISPTVESQPIENNQEITQPIELEVIPPPEQNSP